MTQHYGRKVTHVCLFVVSLLFVSFLQSVNFSHNMGSSFLVLSDLRISSALSEL